MIYQVVENALYRSLAELIGPIGLSAEKTGNVWEQLCWHALRALENTLPPLSARAHDVLHIIWQLFERRGLHASRVDQAWMLCQSIYRGATQPSYPADFFRGKAPQIPGLHLVPHGRHVHHTTAPCVLPRSKMWLNIERRFARGAESLQLQGVHVATW